jgi:hypothetical protein
MPLTFGKEILDEGQFASLVCIVTHGDEPLTITWSLQGEVVSSEPGLTTSALGGRTSMLTIQSVGYRHSGQYTCTASNTAGSKSESVELRVNGEACSTTKRDKRTAGRALQKSFINIFLFFERSVPLTRQLSVADCELFYFRAARNSSNHFWQRNHG